MVEIDITAMLSDAQAALMRWMDDPNAENRAELKRRHVRDATYAVLRRLHFLVESEAYPFHQITEEGRVWLIQDATKRRDEAARRRQAMNSVDLLLADIRALASSATSAHPALITAEHRALAEQFAALDKKMTEATDHFSTPRAWWYWGKKD